MTDKVTDVPGTPTTVNEWPCDSDGQHTGYEDAETDCETCGWHVSERCVKCGEVFDGVWDVEKQEKHDHPDQVFIVWVVERYEGDWKVRRWGIYRTAGGAEEIAAMLRERRGRFAFVQDEYVG